MNEYNYILFSGVLYCFVADISFFLYFVNTVFLMILAWFAFVNTAKSR